jgi:hypothetical protein
MMSRNTPSWAMAVLLLIGLVPTARADTVAATYEGLSAYQKIDLLIGPKWWPSIETGMLRWDRTGGDHAPNFRGTFTSYCIELEQDIRYGDKVVFDVRDLARAPDPGPVMGQTKANYIRELWGRYYTPTPDDEQAAAFQLALWEIVSDTQWDLGSGVFQCKTVSFPHTLTVATGYLASLTGNGQGPGLVGLTNPTYQDHLIPGQVPLPSTLWSSGALILGLATWMRIRRYRSTEA